MLKSLHICVHNDAAYPWSNTGLTYRSSFSLSDNQIRFSTVFGIIRAINQTYYYALLF